VSSHPQRDAHAPGHEQKASPEQTRAPQSAVRLEDPAAATRPLPEASEGGDSVEASSPPVEQGPLKGGELNAAITSALVGIHTQYLGRGPRSASTFHYGHVLVTLMHEVLTPAEKSLAHTNQSEAVDHIRHLFQETMEADFREAVEHLTGRKVLAFISGNHIKPDIAAELFILDGPP